VSTIRRNETANAAPLDPHSPLTVDYLDAFGIADRSVPDAHARHPSRICNDAWYCAGAAPHSNVVSAFRDVKGACSAEEQYLCEGGGAGPASRW